MNYKKVPAILRAWPIALLILASWYGITFTYEALPPWTFVFPVIYVAITLYFNIKYYK